MALDAVIYPQNTFGYVYNELYTCEDSCGLGPWDNEFGLQEDDKTFIEMLNNSTEQYLHSHCGESSLSSILQNMKRWEHNSSPEACIGDQILVEGSTVVEAEAPLVASGRRKRRRKKCGKNMEELENQRMTHIAVERNRRKQMNEHLGVIRSLMPASYVQRGDQASIIGGAINFVKDLEQHLQTLEAQKRTNYQQPKNGHPPLFADFFNCPQYSTHSAHKNSPSSASSCERSTAESRSGLADIEVTMVESHANLKILKKRQPKQLLKIVSGLQCLVLTILHLNVTTIDQLVLYSISVKLEDGCHLNTADEIADAVNHLFGRTQEEAGLN